tara:strand:+ start:307 stop:486 length:180 start_codon:yes stop_codon:yes gene_type:complete
MRKITLSRNWFVTNSANDDEFDYVLMELGIKKDDDDESTDDIDDIEIRVDTDTIEINRS